MPSGGEWSTLAVIETGLAWLEDKFGRVEASVI